MREVEAYLKENYTHYFCNFSLWRLGRNRDIWKFWKKDIGVHTPLINLKRNGALSTAYEYTGEGEGRERREERREATEGGKKEGESHWA